MQFFLDFRTFFIVEWVFKSKLHCQKIFAKSFYRVSLADRMVDRGPAFEQTMDEYFFNF
jgi:hypothetical protein